MEVDPYKQAWGYNRQTALMIPALVRAHREKALAMDLYSKSPPDAFLKAQEASRRYRRSYRREARLKEAAKVRERIAAGWRMAARKKVKDETVWALAAEGLTVKEIATRLGLRNVRYLRGRLITLGLLPPPQRPIPTAELLAFRKAGLWPSEIAARTGMTASAVSQRFEKLRRRGIKVPSPPGCPPNGRRRVSDEQFLELARARLRIKEIAVKAGISYPGVQYRLRILRQRGLLRPSPHGRSRKSRTEA
jgi:DNA-binding CsgD family transcriptional regulator